MRRFLILLLVIAALAVAFALLRPGEAPPAAGGQADGTHGESGAAGARDEPPSPAPAGGLVTPENLPAGTRVVPGKIEDHRFTRLDDGRSIANEGYEAVRVLHQKDLSPEEDLERLEMVMGLYQWAYKSVPEGGENYEIMAGLTGDNPHRIIFFPPDHAALDPDGNLRDRWGTPYFFHKLTGQLVDISSAGPDRRFGTDDDFTLGHTATYEETLTGQ